MGNFALDGICAYAKMVQHMIARKFDGATGPVNIEGNDLPGYLASWQVFGNASVLVGVTDMQGNVNLSWETGLRNDSWTEAPKVTQVEDTEKFPILAIVVPALAIILCGIVCYAVYSGRGAGDQRS